MNEREALDRIAALCDWWDDGETDGELVPIHRVRAILAEASDEAPCEELQGELNDERVLHSKTRARLAEAQARLDRIAALHVESSPDYDYPNVGAHCTTCSDDWPCATAAVLAAQARRRAES